MCAPAVLTFALSAATQVMAFKAQEYQAASEIAAYKQASDAAGKSLTDQMSQENVRLQQEQAAGVEKNLDLIREAKRARGDILASSQSGGMSEELLLADVERQKASYSDTIAANLENQMQQSYWNKQAMAADAQSRVNANAPTTTGGSNIGLGLGILGAGLPLYESYHIKKVKGDVKTRTGGN